MEDNEVRMILDRLEWCATEKGRLDERLAKANHELSHKTFINISEALNITKELMSLFVIKSPDKIKMIKLVRELTGANLKDAKDAVECALIALPPMAPKPAEEDRIDYFECRDDT